MRDVPKVVWVLAAGRVVTSATSFAMLFLTLYLTGPRGLSLTFAGLIVGANGAGMLLGNFTGGRWGDRFGHRSVLLLASSVVGVGLVSIPWLPAVAIAAVLPVVGYLSATAGTSQGALAALAVPPGERRTSVAISRAASNAGFVIGPPVGALLATHSYELLFVAEGAAVLLVRLVTSRMLPRSAVHAVVPEEHAHGLWRSLRANRPILMLLPAIVLVDVVYRQLYTTLPVFLRDHGEPVGLYAALIAVGSGLILCWRSRSRCDSAGCPPYPSSRPATGWWVSASASSRWARSGSGSVPPRCSAWSCSPPVRSSTRRRLPRTCSTRPPNI